jgi:hypothetical protein
MSNMKFKFIEGITDLERVYEHYDGALGIAFIGEERKLYAERMEVYHLLQDLIQHKFKLPFSKKLCRRKTDIEATDLGKRIVEFLERTDALHLFEEDEFFEHKVHSPDMDVFLKIVKAALSEKGAVVDGVGFVEALPIRPDEYRCLIGDDEIDVWVSAYNRLVMTIRKALLSNGMRDAVKSFKRNATERYKQLMRVAEQGWRDHSKNLLIRLDWGFRKKYPAMRTRFKSQTEFESLLIVVDGYRKEMLRILRRMFGENLTFFAWKIECGDIKGIHIHWLIAVNGSKHQDRINVPRHIATEWDMNIGNGKTYTFNVNALRYKEESGLRVIDYSDPELWEIVGRYADYLTKVDYTLKLRMPDKMHSFGCTKLKKPVQSKTGPKRRFQMYQQNISAIRGPQGGRQLGQLN